MVKILFFAAFIFLFSACSEDFFNQVVDIDPPKYEKQLVAHMKTGINDTAMSLSVSRNFGVLEKVPVGGWAVAGALVTMWEGDQILATFTQASIASDFQSALLSPGFFQAGRTYTLQISHPDFDTVNATQTMPQVPAVDSVTFDREGGLNAFGEELSAIDVYLQDPAGEINFYEIFIVGEYEYVDSVFDDSGNLEYVDTLLYESYFTPEGSDDPNVQFGMNNTVLISDQFFNGKPYKLNARIYRFQRPPGYAVYVRNLTEDYYLYSISALRKYNTEGIPFVEPVFVHGNLDNGIGIFGLHNEVVVRVKY